MHIRRGLVALVLVGGLNWVVGCTPKPSAEQLQELSQACAAADQAETALVSKRREEAAAERVVTRSERQLSNMQEKIQTTRTNLEL